VTGERWYRIDDRLYSVANEWGEHDYSYQDVHLTEFPVVRHTPRGVWVDTGFGYLRWVSHGARKRFACPTIEAALESFVARKDKQAAIYDARANWAREAKAKALGKWRERGGATQIG
jgi:hypothetical protein